MDFDHDVGYKRKNMSILLNTSINSIQAWRYGFTIYDTRMAKERLRENVRPKSKPKIGTVGHHLPHLC